jgi:cytochrome P450 family 150 subfamily A5
MTNFESFDGYYEQSIVTDPYPYWDFARERCPVWREPYHGTVLITGYDEAVSIYRDNNRWSSCNTASGLQPFPVPLEGDDVSDLIDEYGSQLIFGDELGAFDPPKHTAHRALLMRLLTPKRLSQNEAFMWRLADMQIDEIIEREECEFIYDFAHPFTAVIISDLLGIPEEEWPEVRAEISKKRLAYTTTGGVDEMVADPFALMRERFNRYVASRRDDPRHDVLSELAQATFPDGTLPEIHEVASIAANLFGAGQETTVHMLSAALRRIAEDPVLQQLLRNDRSRISNFIEEVLRVDTPLKGVFRLSRVPTAVAGVDMPAATTAMLVLGAANRDARFFECPNEFRADRENSRRHLAFGHGIHSCVGASLARAEGRVAIERLFDRTADIRISEAHHGPSGARRYDYRSSYVIRAMLGLHLEYTPQR